MSRRLPLNRRTFLRGTGVALGLPWLDAMAPRGRASSPTPPVRLACIFFPNGVWKPAWVPEQAGPEYALPFSLAPLAPVRDDVLVISNLDKKLSKGGDGHYAKTANFLTGLTVVKTTGREVSVGCASLDQMAAAAVGKETPIPSLELGTEPVISGIDSAVGFTRLYGSHISWRTANQPVAKEINPRLVYQRLFANKSASDPGDRALLDLALEDARNLRRRVGRDDQNKLDEYMEAVRAVERRIEYAARPDPRDWKPESGPAPTPPGTPADFREHIRIMLELMLLAFWTDSTRVASFMFANDVSPRNFSFIDGVKGGHHDTSHHENNPAKIEQYKLINRWHVQVFVDFLQKLKAVREGPGNLLDNSMILFGCGLSDGNSHDPNNLPILVAGRGRGAIRPGRHLSCPKQTPLCNLHLSLLQSMGVPATSFGDSTGPLAGLS
ncbi:MAG: DUF1552 domain-containing protein [Gemmataceae bacterium]|nr:DUF1552 domain-containing protein [Gemmataceae bacterium]